MSALTLLAELERLGASLFIDGDRLIVRVRPGILRPQHREQIRAYKPDIVDLLGERAPVLLDFETRSLAKLRGANSVSGRQYAAHPSTEVLCAVFMLPDGTLVEWVPGDVEPTRALELVRAGAPVVAHNADGFDRHVWRSLGWPDPERWIDTLACAKMAAVPEKRRSLAALGEALVGRKKDLEGAQLTRGLSKKNPRTGVLAPIDGDQLARVIRYCRDDVELLAALYAKLGVFDRIERRVREVDRIINDRGFQFDAELAVAVIECDELSAAEVQAAAGVTPDMVRSRQKLMGRLAQLGVEVPDARKATLARVARTNIPTEARRIVEARFFTAAIAAPKLRAALRRLSADGRLRDSLVYYGAHTGRWSGRGLQPQNLPKGLSLPDGEYDSFIESAIAAARRIDLMALRRLADDVGATLVDVIATLVRPCIVAPAGKLLGVVDYAQIEARALAWMADDTAALQLFRSGGDPYRALASRLFRVPYEAVTSDQRKLGKQAELGCGYQMGADRFQAASAMAGVDWLNAQVTPFEAVEAWRDAHSAVAGRATEARDGRIFRQGGLWQNFERAARNAVGGGQTEVGPTQWRRSGGAAICELPSGRRIIYPEARLEKLPNQKGSRPVFTYLNTRGKREQGYGGKLTENVTQAICRDLLAQGLVDLEEAGLPVVLHVHDEIVCEIESPGDLERMKSVVLTPPSWAADIPLAVSGYAAQRYRK